MGTAPHAEHWLLVQYNAPWGAKAFEESDLLPPHRAALERILTEVPYCRLGLIKRGPRDTGLAVFAVSTQAHNPTMFRYDFDDWDSLSEASGLFSGHGGQAWVSPLYAVCTNGKRDRCCAELGVPLYNRLLSMRPQAVWQITHIGGHRFAGNLVCFPQGLVYGRVDEDSGPDILAQHENGLISLTHYRGRSTWPEAVQAAEVLFRQARQESRIEYIRSAHAGPDGRITFHLAEGGPVTVAVEAVPTGLSVQASCGRGKAEPVTEYHLTESRE